MQFYPRYLRAIDFGLLHERKRLFAGNYPTVNVEKCHSRPVIDTPVAQIRGYGHGKESRKQISETARKLSGNNGDTFEGTVTVEFCAWLMGFPARYVFAGTRNEQYIQIGHAVCPPVSKAIWQSIKENKRKVSW
jgi:site-specific DNA-cytosine methylase